MILYLHDQNCSYIICCWIVNKKNYEQVIQLKNLSRILLKDISFKEMEKKTYKTLGTIF